jgi:hypothetical protein
VALRCATRLLDEAIAVTAFLGAFCDALEGRAPVEPSPALVERIVAQLDERAYYVPTDQELFFAAQAEAAGRTLVHVPGTTFCVLTQPRMSQQEARPS